MGETLVRQDVRERLDNMSQTYGRALEAFIDRHGLNVLVFPLDHVAIKLKNAKSYEDYLREIEQYAVSLSENPNIDGRRMAIATLKSYVAAAHLPTRHLQIMEPKPGKTGNDEQLDHAEMVMTYVDRLVAEALGSRGIDFTDRTNLAHRTFTIKINDEGQELKYTDKAIARIEAEEIAAGKSCWIKAPRC